MFSAPYCVTWKSLIPSLLFVFSILPVSHAQESDLETKQSGAKTTVYKVVNPDGSVSFSDQPGASSEILQIESVPTIPALSPQKINNADSQQRDAQVNTPATSYQSLSIVSPADQSAFNSGSGDVSVLLELSPGLANGHEIELRLNNKVVKRGSQTQFTLPAVDRGTHTLQARIISPAGEVLKEAYSSFTLHRPSILR